MRWVTSLSMLLTAALMNFCVVGALHAGQLRVWGQDRDRQVTGIPAGTDFVAIAAGDAHGLALRADGTVVAWGQNDDGECDVPAGTYKAIGAGADFSLAIRTDGSIAVWGDDGQGQVSDVPTGNNFIAVDGGERFAVALRSDGSIAAWGNNRWGQVSDVPAGTGFKAIAAGDDHAVALRFDGTLVAWGYWAAVEGAPTSGLFTAIGAGGSLSVALAANGSIVQWGDDPYGYTADHVPTGTGFVAVAAGYLHGLAIARDGSVVGWGAGTDASGHPNWGQAMPPAGNDYTAVAGGLYFSLALAGKTDPTVPQDPTDPMEPNVPPEPTVLGDDFNDNRLAGSWTLQGDDLLNCELDEVNQRLELTTTSKTQGISTYCLGNGWSIDPKSDFSFKVDYHYSLVSERGGWVFFGITPDVNDLETRYVKLGVGCDRQYPYFWFESIDGKDVQMDYNSRRQDEGTLYVSYDAARDELYLSSLGYGAENAWVVIAGVLGTSWNGQPVTVFLGGGATGQEIGSGDAWLDNFIVETDGASPQPFDSISDVYRFWSPVLSRHFYTVDSAERDKLIREYPEVWTYEGPAYKAATSAFLAGLKPVYRFWSPIGESHFYTIDEAEKDQLVKEFPDVWTFEGVAFYAYPEGAQPADGMPVYRFWKPDDNSHFYTMDPAERDKLIREYAEVYVFEGVAFCAFRL